MTSTACITKARKLARRLNLEHNKKGRSWRKIAQDYPGVNFATLNRIALSRGEWAPADIHIQELLGLTRKPHEKKVLPIIGMGHNWESVFFKQPKKGRK